MTIHDTVTTAAKTNMKTSVVGELYFKNGKNLCQSQSLMMIGPNLW